MIRLIILRVLFLSTNPNYSRSINDTVTLVSDYKLISEVKIIIDKDEYFLVENYTYFKYHYWKGENDTINSTEKEALLNPSSKKNRIISEVHICDSTINQIRNSARYWEMDNEIRTYSKNKIGYRNETFKSYWVNSIFEIRNFQSKCLHEFTVELEELKYDLIEKVDRLYESKIYRLNEIIENQGKLTTDSINSFLASFNHCITDYKAIESILLSDASGFFESIKGMNSSDLSSLKWKLRMFPEEINVQEIKKHIKESIPKSELRKFILKNVKYR